MSAELLLPVQHVVCCLNEVIPVQLLLQVREGTGREGRGKGWKMTSTHMGLRDNHWTKLKSFTPIESRSSLFAFELQFCTTTYAPPLPPPPPPPPAKFVVSLTNEVSLLERVSLCQGWPLRGVSLYVHCFPQQLTVCDFLHVDASSQSSGSAA